MIIQTRIVILIAILALARKIVILDFSTLSAAAMGGLAALTLGLASPIGWLARGMRTCGNLVISASDLF